MNEIEYRFIGDSPELQRLAVDMLAECFDVWAQRKIEFNGRFPFREYSFIALAQDGKAIGHLGVIPFDVCAGDSTVIRMAGIASVAVAPQHRNCGIAGTLCRMAEKWAVENKFDALPLYTSVMPLYEKHHWRIFPTAMRTLQRPATAVENSALWKPGSTLTAAEKQFVISCYEALAPLPGRVIRVHDDYAANSWARLFSKSNHLWHLTERGYILCVDGFIGELGGELTTIPPGVDQAFLFAHDPAYIQLQNSGWEVAAGSPLTPVCWEGETVMMNIIHPEKIPPELGFPLAHKF